MSEQADDRDELTSNPDDANASPIDDLERWLPTFQPAPLSLDRGELMFLAGQAAAQSLAKGTTSTSRTAWYWPLCTALSLGLSLVLAITLIQQRSSVHPMAKIDRAKIDRTEVDRTEVDRTEVDRTNVDRTNVDRTNVDRAVVAEPQSDPLRSPELEPALPEQSFFRLQQIALQKGVDAIPNLALRESSASVIDALPFLNRRGQTMEDRY